MSSYDALLGNVYNSGNSVELGGGLNFASGLQAVYNTTTKRIDVTATGGGGGGSGGHTIQNEGSDLPDRPALDFVGPNVDVTDTGVVTRVTISGPSTAYVDAGDAAVVAAIPSPGGAPQDVTRAAASAGVAGSYSRSDHKHNVSTAAPADQAISASSAEGTATSLARSDHTHHFTGTVGHWVTVDASGNVGGSDVALSSKTISYSAADAVGASLTLRKSRGTSGSPTAHNASDVLGSLVVQGRDASAYADMFALEVQGEQAGGTGKRARVRVKFHNGVGLVTSEESFRFVTTTSNATQSTAFSISVGENETVFVCARCVAKQTSGGSPGTENRLVYETKRNFRRKGSANITQFTQVDMSPVANLKDDATWGDPTIEMNTGTQAADFKQQGKASTDITWEWEVTISVR